MKKVLIQYRTPAYVLILSFLSTLVSHAQNNSGLALTPPMEWSSWYTFVDTINEKKIMETADAMVTTGLRDAGYTILQLDDGWMAKARNAQNQT